MFFLLFQPYTYFIFARQILYVVKNINLRLFYTQLHQAKMILQRTMADTFLATFNNVGKKPASFTDAISVAEEVLSHEADTVDIVYNSFINVVSYNTTVCA